MSDDDLKNLKELESKNKPRILTMYFEDGGETSVIPYDDYYDLQQRIGKAIEYITRTQYDEELHSHVYGITYTGTQKLLSILKGEDK